MPTRSGFTFLLILFAMLLTSMNYGNNMAYSLVFLCLGFFLVGYIHSRENLKGLEISSIQPLTAFAGEPLGFVIEAKNQSKKHKTALYIKVGQGSETRFFGPYHLAPQETQGMEITLPTLDRGLYHLHQITFITTYPLGLFRALRSFKVDQPYVVFPKPGGHLPWPPVSVASVEYAEGFHFSGGEDFSGHRPFRAGESQKHIDWKAYARGRPLNLKEFTGGGTQQQWFEWNHLSGLGDEERVSQLTRWVLQADEMGIEYGLKIPGEVIEQDCCSRHTLACLTALALFGEAR